MNKGKQTKKLDFSGQDFFIGMDVHKKEWTVSIYSKDYELKTFVQPADPRALLAHLHSTYPNGNYHTVYEAGFSGFWIHKVLAQHGVNNVVINPSDIPTTDKEKKAKTDRVDARKLAKGLRAKQLTAIYVPEEEVLEERYLLRQRKKFVKDGTRCKNRIKTMLNFLGIKIPHQYEGPYWSKAFKRFLLTEAVFKTASGKTVIHSMLDELENIEKNKKVLEKQIVVLSKNKYKEQVGWLRSIPGIGLLGAMTILTELVDITRFKNLESLYNYVGLVPNCHSSGDNEHMGRISQRCNQYLRPILVQCAWKAIKVDNQMLCCFMELTKRMKKNKAIIRIARKQLSRVSYVLKNKTCI